MSTEVNCWQLIATPFIVVRTKTKRTFFIWIVRVVIYSRKKLFILRLLTNEWCVWCATAYRSTHKAESFIKKKTERIKRNYIFRMHWFLFLVDPWSNFYHYHRRHHSSSPKVKWHLIRTHGTFWILYGFIFSNREWSWSDVGTLVYCIINFIYFCFWFRAAVACSFTLILPNM